MRQNPHVRICGGPGSATTLVYPTDQRRRLAVLDRRLGRAYLQEVVTIVTPDRGPAGQDTP